MSSYFSCSLPQIEDNCRNVCEHRLAEYILICKEFDILKYIKHVDCQFEKNACKNVVLMLLTSSHLGRSVSI